MILSVLSSQQTFIDKAGPEILNQMYTFSDKAGRPICLIPEATAIVQKLYKDTWSRNRKKPIKVFYVTRCYRYEKPQLGRYREFTQIGVEILGGEQPQDRTEAERVLKGCLDQLEVDYNFVPLVQRGLDYYIEDGFEVECTNLGAQKQIAGGGRYDVGVGWAIGLDRLLLAKNRV